MESHIPDPYAHEEDLAQQDPIVVELPGFERAIEKNPDFFKVYGEDGRPSIDRGEHPNGLRQSDAEIGITQAREVVAQIYASTEPFIKKPQSTANREKTDSDKIYPYVGFHGAPNMGESKEKAPNFKVRQATMADIPNIVDVDLRAFDSVYSNYDENPEALRRELTEKFTGRLEKVGGKWMPVLERDGEIVGFMTCCPTSKKPEDFKSWEDTTDNGTLETTYDPKGENVYVVTLSVLPAGSAAKDRLFVDQMSQMFKSGQKTAFFESRLPGLRNYAKKKARYFGLELDYVEPRQLDNIADEYFNLKTKIKGKDVPYDRLLRLYDRIGCKFIKVVPNAYKDEPSLDYGVVCTYDGNEFFDGSLLPVKIPDNMLTRKSLSAIMKMASKSQTLTSKLLSE
jgi:hypothetical protein